VATLADTDGFLRFQAVRALGRLRRADESLTVPADPVIASLMREANRYFSYLSLHFNLVHHDPVAKDTLLARALDEKLHRTVDRIYRLLSLVYPWKDIAAARWTLEHGDSRGRAGALEYLDNLLTGPVRKRVLPVLEEVPLEEKVRRGNVLLKSRIRDAEDSLAQLVHDEDQIVAATAIHFVEARGLWALESDLEYALEHRDARDWHVFEASSWALAARRMAAEKRREKWMEPLPVVELSDRLRRMALFDFVSVDELFRIAAAGRQVRHENGQLLYEQGTHPDDLQFLLDGSVSRRAEGEPPQDLVPPAALGFEEVLEGAPAAATIRAVQRAICLALRNEQVLQLLAENAELAQGLFRMVLERSGGDRWGGVARRTVTHPSVARLEDGVQAIEKILVMEEMPILARAQAEDIAALAAIAREVPLTAGELLFREGDAPALYVLLAGELSLEPMAGGEPVHAASGDTVGVYETLSGAETTGWRAHVTTSGTALRIEREAFFDLLTERIELLQDMFSALLHRRTDVLVA